MSEFQLSTIAQLLFADPQTINFARIVGEFESVLTRLRGNSLKVLWDCEDVVMMDFPGTRIVLGWSDHPGHGYGGALLVSVGPETEGGLLAPQDQGHDPLCSRLVERIQARHTADAILWHQAPGPVGSALVDALFEAIPAMNDLLAEVSNVNPMLEVESVAAAPAPVATHSLSDLQAQAEPAAADPMTAAPLRHARRARREARRMASRVANDQPQSLRPRDPELARLREALYPEPDASEVSVQMRLAVHTLNATLVMVSLPLGAAVMTYSLFRGANMRLSSRAMAVAGTTAAIAQTPFLSQMAAFAGVM